MAINAGINNGERITPPVCRANRAGLFTVAPPTDMASGHWETGVTMESLPCDGDVFALTPCPTTPPDPKDAGDGNTAYEDGDPFTLVAGYECSVGGNDEDPWDMAAARLDRGEERGVERAYWTGVDRDGNPIRSSLSMDAGVIDLTPEAGATNITSGIALLDSWAGENYPCQPVFHLSRGLSHYLVERELLKVTDDMGAFMKGSGAPVVLGGGYLATGPNGEAAPAGEGWMYATGGVRIVRGPVFFTPERGNTAAAIDRSSNDIRVFAERPYAVVHECFTLAVRVKLSTCCC